MRVVVALISSKRRCYDCNFSFRFLLLPILLFRYEEYKKKYVQRLMRAFFEDHKKEEWLQERYSPAIRHRLDVQKRSKKITEAKSFSERVRNGTAKICLDENADLPNKDFDNDMEDSTRILYIRRIPCACPVTSLSESIKKAVCVSTACAWFLELRILVDAGWFLLLSVTIGRKLSADLPFGSCQEERF